MRQLADRAAAFGAAGWVSGIRRTNETGRVVSRLSAESLTPIKPGQRPGLSIRQGARKGVPTPRALRQTSASPREAKVARSSAIDATFMQRGERSS